MRFGQIRGAHVRFVGIALLAAMLATSCTNLMIDEVVISGDAMNGRQNDTPGSVKSQDYLIYRLKSFAVGLDPSKTGDAAFKQAFDGGTNVLAKIPGTDLASQNVIIGAHYDHLGTSCRTSRAADVICNGATDNGAGVAALLTIGEMIKANGPTRRTVIFALWDREEDGLRGSKYYTDHPLVPLAQTSTYINFDIQGANLLPSLQNASFAVGAETGGAALRSLVQSAIAAGPLQTRLVSSLFGQGRSDYVNFTNVGVPNVFFSDSTGPCYHTAQDDVSRVDFWKLQRQAEIGYRLAISLIQSDTRPAFVADNPLATFEDAVSLRGVVTSALGDIGRFTPTQQTTLLAFRDQLDAVVAAGAANFGPEDITPLLGGAASAVSILTSGVCDGFISQH